jgi:cellulose synthase/poly-beta-1,6-N-acetylglucosamine synthase-like glycosyltransferase
VSPTVASAVLLAYYLVLGALAVTGLHRLVLLARWWRSHRQPLAPPPEPAEWPDVTVQLPLYNERWVAERLLRAVATLDYPRQRLHVQVLDDSTDETTGIVAAVSAELRAGGLDVAVLHRDARPGFKAGALAAGLSTAPGDLLCVFDADFVPPRDFLRRVVPWFADPGVGMVQARWSHLNREASLLTRAQAVMLDGHFAIEHAARHRSGCFFNFNGTAGVWRRAAIEAGGGWQADTLTEDLDLSYRAQLAGWRFVFLPELAVPAELPAEVADFKAQQQRWARGAAQTCRKLLPRVLVAPLPARVKTEAVFHLTQSLAYPLMVALALLIFPAMILRRGTDAWKLLAIDLPLFGCATVSVLLFYLGSQLAVRAPLGRAVRVLPAVMALGIGLSVANSGAVAAGLLRRGGTFQRTPKYRLEARGSLPWQGSYGGGQPLSLWVEGGLTLWFAACVATALPAGMWLSVPFLYLFLQGYGYLFLLGVRAATARLRPRRGDPEPVPR